MATIPAASHQKEAGRHDATKSSESASLWPIFTDLNPISLRLTRALGSLEAGVVGGRSLGDVTVAFSAKIHLEIGDVRDNARRVGHVG